LATLDYCCIINDRFKSKNLMIKTIVVKGNEISILKVGIENFISITDMIKSKDGDFFISDWLRNRNSVEYLGIWEWINNPDFNYGEFAIIKSNSKLNF
jgi:hypothetical protein